MEQETGREAMRPTWQVLLPLASLLILFGALLYLFTEVIKRLQINGAYRPENSLPVLLLVGIVALLSAIAVTVIVFKRLDLATERAPLGLPEGSVRAIIALMLLVMFFITALYLYADLGQTRQPRRLQSVSQAFVDSIPRDELIAVTPLNPDATAADARYDVMIGGLPQSQAATDLAKQLVTTISTLVVAVASFYFGANTVQSATRRRPPPSGPGAAPVPEPEPEPEAAPVNEDAEKRDDDERPLAG